MRESKGLPRPEEIQRGLHDPEKITAADVTKLQDLLRTKGGEALTSGGLVIDCGQLSSQESVLRAYLGQYGWALTRTDDQRDGSFYRITAATPPRAGGWRD